MSSVARQRGEPYQATDLQAADLQTTIDVYAMRAGPNTPPIQRMLKQQQTAWGNEPLHLQKHVSALEREKADAPAKEAALRQQAQRVHQLVGDAFATVCATHGEVFQSTGTQVKVRLLNLRTPVIPILRCQSMHVEVSLQGIHSAVGTVCPGSVQAHAGGQRIFSMQALLQTDSLEATLSLLHRSKLEIEKARAVLEHGPKVLSSKSSSAAIAASHDCPQLTPRRAAYVRRMVQDIFQRAVQQADDPLQLTVRQSRLEREQVRLLTTLCCSSALVHTVWALLGQCYFVQLHNLAHNPTCRNA